MKKKMLVMLFVLVLTVSAFSMTAHAVTEIGTIGIENLLAPLAGNKPDYDIDYINVNLVSKQYIEGYSPINGICWFELTQANSGSTLKEREMAKNESFELGKKYRVRIFVMPNNSSTVFKDSVTAKIYEMTADVDGMTYKSGTVTVPTGNTNSEYRVVSATYECTKKSIVSVEVTGLKIPKAGEYPDNDCNVLTEGVYANGMVTWTHKLSENNYEAWDYDEAFVAGETYKYSLWLRTDFANGYRFRTDANGENIADIMVNGIVIGEDNICDTWDIDYVRGVEYEYFVPFKTITNIDIVGISVPIAGKEPDYEAFPTAAGYDIVGLSWVDITEREALIGKGMTYVQASAQAKLVKGDGKTFEEGHEYLLCMEVKPQDGYEIDYDAEDILYFAATVNGKDASEGSGYRGENAFFDCNFGLPVVQSIFNVDASGVDSPVAGKVPDYDAVCGADSYDIIDMYWVDITERAALIGKGMTYVQASAQAKLSKGDGKTFTAGHRYSVYFEAEPHKNYEIDYDPTDFDILYFNATVNGEDAKEISGYRGENAVFYYEFAHTCTYNLVKKTEATCNAEGKQAYYKCSCGKISEDAVGNKLINDIASWGIIPVAANSHKGGTATCRTRAKCTVCSAYYGSLNANNHKNITTLEAKAATYKATGLTAGKKCTDCGKIIVAQKKTDRKKLKKVSGLKTKAVKLASGTKSSLSLTWSKVTGAEKYEIQQYISKKWKTIKTTSKTSYTVTKLKSNKSYKFRVRAIAGTNKGSYSSAYTGKTVPLKTALTLKAGKKQLTASWKEIANITGYEVTYSTSKKFTKKTTKTVTVKKAKTKKTTIKKLSKGKKYYVKVRAYKTVGKTKIYSAWSSVKNVRVK